MKLGWPWLVVLADKSYHVIMSRINTLIFFHSLPVGGNINLYLSIYQIFYLKANNLLCGQYAARCVFVLFFIIIKDVLHLKKKKRFS